MIFYHVTVLKNVFPLFLCRLLEQIGSEIIYVLPTEDKNVVKKFEILFSELDRYKKQMKIKSYGLSDTTLEEVSPKICCLFENLSAE